MGCWVFPRQVALPSTGLAPRPLESLRGPRPEQVVLCQWAALTREKGRVWRKWFPHGPKVVEDESGGPDKGAPDPGSRCLSPAGLSGPWGLRGSPTGAVD